MRITSGEFRGLNLSVPSGDDVRPTQDRVREALFSMLGECVQGALFLDVFAGSGAVGLEAISRGASRAVFVERDSRAFTCLTANIARCNAADRCDAHRADALAWLASHCKSPSPQAPFDVAFADPPYALASQGVYFDAMRLLADGNYMSPNGIFVAEMASHHAPDESPAWELIRDRTYGQSRIAIYRRKP